MQERKEYINWDSYFSMMAILTSLRSKDPHLQVGAIIVSSDNRILATGYNGSPIGIEDKDISWGKTGNYLDTKYPYVVHAELNAILNNKAYQNNLVGSTLYTTLFPCNECAKAIVQSGIKNVVYLSNHCFERDMFKASYFMLSHCGIVIRSYSLNNLDKQLLINSLSTPRELIDIKKEDAISLSLKKDTKKEEI